MGRTCLFPNTINPLMASQLLLLHRRSGQVSSATPGSQERPGPAVSVPSRQIDVQKYPKLTIGADQLFCHQSLETNLQPFMQRLLAQLGWSTRFFELFMGGVQVGVAFQWDNPQRGLLTSMMIHILQKQGSETTSHCFAGGDVAHTRVSRDIFLNPTPSRRARKNPKNEDCKDEWVWKDEVTLMRVHKTPRRRMFVPKEADFLPCRLKRFRYDRETYQIFQSSGRTINDSWRLAGNNIERTNRRNEFWTGTTTFKIISNADINNLLDSGSDVEDRASCQNSVVTCTFDGNMKIIPLDDMFYCPSIQTEAWDQKGQGLGYPNGTTPKEWNNLDVSLPKTITWFCRWTSQQHCDMFGVAWDERWNPMFTSHVRRDTKHHDQDTSQRPV